MAIKHPGHAHGKAISVTQTDIDIALRNNSTHCAVAEAVARELQVTRVLVDIQTIRYSDEQTDKRYIFLTPPAVQDYIIAYDAGDAISPFTFTLPTPAYVGERHHRHDSAHRIDYKSRVRVPVYSSDSPNTSTHRSVPVDQPPRAHTSSVARAYGLRKMRRNQPTPTQEQPA